MIYNSTKINKIKRYMKFKIALDDFSSKTIKYLYDNVGQEYEDWVCYFAPYKNRSVPGSRPVELLFKDEMKFVLFCLRNKI